jgi:hypothetical protein
MLGKFDSAQPGHGVRSCFFDEVVSRASTLSRNCGRSPKHYEFIKRAQHGLYASELKLSVTCSYIVSVQLNYWDLLASRCQDSVPTHTILANMMLCPMRTVTEGHEKELHRLGRCTLVTSCS